jgi:hypothetical protein
MTDVRRATLTGAKAVRATVAGTFVDHPRLERFAHR